MKKDSIISVIKTNCRNYPKPDSLYRPGIRYPEYPLQDISGKENKVYDAVRESFHLMDLDKENYGTSGWNPLERFVHPNDYVLLKPNLVIDYNQNRFGGKECLYTHPSVTAAVVDYVVIALRGSGKIVIGDAPLQECNFNKLLEESGYKLLAEYYKNNGIDIEIVDFRQLKSMVRMGVHIAEINETVSGTIVDLKDTSEFFVKDGDALSKMRVTNYDPRVLVEHHNLDKHEYFISNYVLNADVIINLPKPKTHRKAGATIALKNFVGANIRKEYLPHHTMGARADGGDEYARKSHIHTLRSRCLDEKNICEAEHRYNKARLLYYGCRLLSLMLKLKRDTYREGSWYGNDTVNRTIADLNKIIYHADRNGRMQDEPVRNIFIVADMIISGEKEGPLAPSPKDAGLIAAGVNPVCFDEAIATLMGFDMKKIPSLVTARNIRGKYRLTENDDEPLIVSNYNAWDHKKPSEISKQDLLNFHPTSGWINHIER